MTDKTDCRTAASSAGWVAGDGPLDDEEDFDALLAASSFGSEQARAIREQIHAAARERVRRVLDGEEECAPVEGDIDNAVSGLVYGLARGVVPGPTVLALEGCTLPPMNFLTARTDLKLVVLAACQTTALWPDHRAHLLQALIDHDAFADLRLDVAWNIVDWAFDVPRPPRVLRQCVELAVEQIDVSALAVTWLSSTQGELVRRSCLYLACHGAANYPAAHERPGDPEAAEPALEPAPVRAALTAGSTKPATKARAKTVRVKQLNSRRVGAHSNRPPRAPRAAIRRKMSLIAAAAATVSAVIAAVLIGRGHHDMQQTSLHRLSSYPSVGLQTASPPARLQVTFKSGTTEFANSTTAASELAAISKLLADDSSLNAEVMGFTAAVGTAADQTRLSLERAELVRAELTELGAASTQITAAVYGSSFSVVPSIPAQNVVRIVMITDTAP